MKSGERPICRVKHVCLQAKWPNSGQYLPLVSSSMKRLGVFLLPRSISNPPPPFLDGMVVHCRVTAPTLNLLVHVHINLYTYTWVERGTVRVCVRLNVLPKITTQCPRPGLKSRLLYPESCILIMSPPCIPHQNVLGIKSKGMNASIETF